MTRSWMIKTNLGADKNRRKVVADYHRCSASPCPVSVPYHQLACRRHWFQLPKDLRVRINSSWLGKRRAEHQAAMQEAISFWRSATPSGPVREGVDG